MFRDFSKRQRHRNTNRFPRPRPQQNNANNFNVFNPNHHRFDNTRRNNDNLHQFQPQMQTRMTMIWELPSTRMESDVEEGEIRESELLSPLSEDEELEQVEKRQQTPSPPPSPPHHHYTNTGGQYQYHRKRFRPTSTSRDYDRAFNDKSRKIAKDLATNGGWQQSLTPRRAEIPPAPRKGRRKGNRSRQDSPEQVPRARWKSGDSGITVSSDGRIDNGNNSPPYLKNVHSRKRYNDYDNHKGLSLEESTIPSPTCNNSSGGAGGVDVDQQQQQSHPGRHLRALARNIRHRRSRTIDDGGAVQNVEFVEQQQQQIMQSSNNTIRGIPVDIQENHVIVFCDPPRSPDMIQDDDDDNDEDFEALQPIPVVLAEEMDIPQQYQQQQHVEKEQKEENVEKAKEEDANKDEDNEVEVLSIIDKSTRVAELIVIDSTSSSESELETDYEDPDADPNRGVLPPPRPPSFVPPPPPVPLSSPVSSIELGTPPSPTGTNMVEMIDSPPIKFNEILENDKEISIEKTTKKYGEPPNQGSSSSITTTTSPQEDIILGDNNDDEDLEVLELRIKALKGLMQKLPSSQPEDKVLFLDKEDGTREQPATTTAPSCNNPLLPDDSEKENENELELECLRSKLLSDLATQKKRKEAIDLLKLKQRTESMKKSSTSTASTSSSSTSKRHTERRTSKSYTNANNILLTSSTRASRSSGRRKSSAADVSASSSSSSHNHASSTNKVPSSSGSHANTHHRHSSSSSSSRRTAASKTSSSAKSKSSTPKSSLLPSNMSSISISVSKDGRRRTVTSRENPPTTTTNNPDISSSSFMSPIVIQADSQQRVVHILDPVETMVSPTPKLQPYSSSVGGVGVGPKPKKPKMSSPQKVITRSASRGPQKVLTQPPGPSSLSNIPHSAPPPTLKMTPFSHKVPPPAKSPNEFSITRTIVNPNAFKSKYNNRKNFHNSINRTTRGGGPSQARKKIQPIVIQLRNNDESTEDDDEDNEEDGGDEDNKGSSSSTTSASLPQEFHSSLDKFLKSVRESASINGLSGNPYLQNTNGSSSSSSSSSSSPPPLPLPVDNNNLHKQSTIPIPTALNVLPSSNVSIVDIDARSSNDQQPSIQNQVDGEQNLSPFSLVPLSSPADTSVADNNQSIFVNSPSPSTRDVAGKTTSSSPGSMTSIGGVQDDDNDGRTSAASNPNNEDDKPIPSPFKIIVPSPLSSPTPGGANNNHSNNNSPMRSETHPSENIQRPFTAPEMSTLDQVDQVLQRSLESSTTMASKSELLTKRASTTTGTTSPQINRSVSKSPRKDNNNKSNNGTGESLADQFTRTREELQLREKLLRATFKKSETKIRLTRTEKDFLTSRKSATNLLGSAIDKINQHVEKKLQCSRAEQQVEKLRKQLEVAEKSLYFKNIEADSIHEDAVSTISKAFDMRSKSVTFGIECKKLGTELTGESYKIPSTGAGDMLTKFKEIYKLTTKDELKKGPINFKKLEEQIITSIKGHSTSNNKNTVNKTTSIETIATTSGVGSITTRPDNNQESVDNVPSSSQLMILEKNRGLSGIIIGGLTRHVLEPDRHIRPLMMIMNEESHYFSNFLLSPPKTSRAEIESRQSKFVPYLFLFWGKRTAANGADDGSILSTIDCNAVICQNIVLSNCNSHNCKFQHLPESMRSINSNDN